MLKYIQEILQNLLKEPPKTKIKHKTRTNSFVSSKRKTSIRPEILAPVNNEKHEFENSHRFLEVKKTYHMLMSKLISPNFDLIPQRNKIVEQIRNMDMKKHKEMFSSLLSNKFFIKTKKKKLTGTPLNEKLCIEEKIQHISAQTFEVGWAGQATTKELLKPIVEVATKYPFDIDSAFFDYTDNNDLNVKKSGKEHKKKFKKIGQRRKKPFTYLSSNRKSKKSSQLIKEIPKSHIGKMYRLSAQRKERVLRVNVLEPLQGVNVSDSSVKPTVTEETESKMQPISTVVSFKNNSDKKDQTIEDTENSNKVEKTEFVEEKELKNTGMADNCDELSQNDHTQHIKQNNIVEHSKYETHDQRFINNQMCSNENMPERNCDEQNTDDSLTKFEGKFAEIQYHQKNLDNTSETSPEVDSRTNKIRSRSPVFSENDQMNSVKGSYLEKSKENEDHPNCLINNNRNENHTYINYENTSEPDLKNDSDQINQIPMSNTTTKNEGDDFLEEKLSLPANKSMNTDPTCGNRQTNHGFEPILQNINLSSVPIEKCQKENSLKKSSKLTYKKENYLKKQYLKETKSPVMNEEVYNKIFKKEQVGSNTDILYSKSSKKVKKSKKVKTGKLYKKHVSKSIGIAEEKALNNNKMSTNLKKSVILSKTQKNNKKNSKTEVLKDLLNNKSLLSTGMASSAKTTKKLNNKSTESLDRKIKLDQVVSFTATGQRREDLTKKNSKIHIKKITESNNHVNRTHPYLNGLIKENKGPSNDTNIKQSTMLLKTKKGDDSLNKSKFKDSKRLSSTTVDKLKGIPKKPKNVGVVNSDYVKFIENKAWFLGNPLKITTSKNENTFSGNTKKNLDGSLKFASFKLVDVNNKNSENVFTKRASTEITKNICKESKDTDVNKEKLPYTLGKCKLKKRIVKIATVIKDPKSNKNCDHLKVVKPISKILVNNIHATNKLEQNRNNSLCPNFKKQTENKVDMKVLHKFDYATSNLTRKRELVSKKTKPSFQMSKSLFDISAPVCPKEINSDVFSSISNTRKNNTVLRNVVNQTAIKSIVNYDVSTKGFDKTRKLHSKKLGSKHSDLKMYGVGQNTTTISDLHSLRSIQVVHNNDSYKTNLVSSLPTRIETKKCSAKHCRNEMVQSNNKIFPLSIQSKHFCTGQDTGSVIVNYLCKRFSTTAAKNIQNNYFGLLTDGAFPRRETIVKGDNFLKLSNNLAVKTNVKRTIIRNGANKIKNAISESADSFKRKGANTTEVLFKSSEGDIPVSVGKPLNQEKDYSFEVLYERNKTKSNDHLVKNLQQQDNKLLIKTSNHSIDSSFGTFNSNNISHIIHNKPFKYDERKIKNSLDNTNKTQLKEPHILLTKQIMNHKLSANTTTNNYMSKGKQSIKNNKDRNFEINKDFSGIKPNNIVPQLKSCNKLNILQKETKGNEKAENKANSLFNIREDLLEKPVPDKPENIKNDLKSKEIKSLPSLNYTCLEPINLSVLKPLRWKSKSDRLNNFVVRKNRSEVKSVKKKTLMKPSIIQSNHELNNYNKETINNNVNLKGDNRKVVLINTKNTSVQTSKSKENRNSNVNSFAQDGRKQLERLQLMLKKTTALSKKISNKDVSLTNFKQKAILPIECKLVSKVSFNTNSLKQNKLENPKTSDIVEKKLNTDKAELVKSPVSKPILRENQTIFSNTLSGRSEANNCATAKRSRTIRENEMPIVQLRNVHRTNSDETKCSELKSKNKETSVPLSNPSVAKNYEKTNQNIVKNGEKEIPLIKFNEDKKTNKNKSLHNRGTESSLMKIVDKPKLGDLTSFDLNFNLPGSIMAQTFKRVKDSAKENDKEKAESIKRLIIAKLYYDQLQLLKADVPNKHKKAIDILKKQEGIHCIKNKTPSKIKNLSNFKPELKSTALKSIPGKEKETLNNDVSGETHKLYNSHPPFPFNSINRKSNLMKETSLKSKEDQSKKVKAIVSCTDKKPSSKHPRLPVGLLAKQLMKSETRLVPEGNTGDKPITFEKLKKPNSFKIVNKITAEPIKTSKEICLATDEKENKSDLKKELIMITGSNLSLNFDKLIKNKGRDKFYISRKTENANTKPECRENVNEGPVLVVDKKAKSKIVSAKSGNNKASIPNKCLEKIVDYGIEKGRCNLLYKGLKKNLKAIKTSETSGNCKAKNLECKPSMIDSPSIQTKNQDKFSNSFSSTNNKTNLSMSSEDIGKMKNIIRSTNKLKVFKGNRLMKKRQLQLVERNHQLGKDLLQKECDKKEQSNNQKEITGGNLPKVPVDNFIYLSPANPQSKGVYVIEINPSKGKEGLINSHSEVLKSNSAVSFNKNHVQYHTPNPLTNERKSLRSR